MSIKDRFIPTPRLTRGAVNVVLASSAVILTACSSDSTTAPNNSAFLGGTSSNHQIGLVLNSTGKSLSLFQLGSPTTMQQIALGTSGTVTPTDFSVNGRNVAIPLGDAASVAFVNLNTKTVSRYFLFPAGNTTGSVFVNDTTVIVANLLQGYVGRFTTNQVSDTIKDTVTVAPQPTALVMAGSRAMVISTNEDANYVPLGNGIVTAVDPVTMHVLGSVATGGTNPQGAALGPDGLLYVVNTGDYIHAGSLTIIDPTTLPLQVQTTVPNMGVGPGAISIDANGLAYISSYSYGTIVWNTRTRQFVRDASNPVCAPGGAGGCRTAASAVTDSAGDLYQVFAGDPSNPPEVFVYHVGTFALTDSIATGSGPSSVHIQTF